MAARQPILDTDALTGSLRSAVSYAAAAGLLTDKQVLGTLRQADATLAVDGTPDAEALTLALNHVAAAMAPITLADLNCDRNPLSADNQRRARLFQMVLTFFALVVLVHIGYFMHSLRLEQAVISSLDAIQALKPQQKMVALRKLAQFEKPLIAQSTLHDQYHDKVSELVAINDRLVNVYVAAVQASQIPLFPGEVLLRRAEAAWAEAPSPVPSAHAAAPVGTTAGAPMEGASSAGPAICEEAVAGSIRLPEDAMRYPQWMRLVLSDTLSDFCFQLKVFSPNGRGTLINQSLTRFSELPFIQEKVSLRVDWFLPFFFGLLGATLFMMRSVGNIRLPAMAAFAIIMRISLGGVAGIAIGWFSIGVPGNQIQATSAVSLPFVLSFVVGYGIDTLFALLDKLNRLVGDVAGQVKPA